MSSCGGYKAKTVQEERLFTAGSVERNKKRTLCNWNKLDGAKMRELMRFRGAIFTQNDCLLWSKLAVLPITTKTREERERSEMKAK